MTSVEIVVGYQDTVSDGPDSRRTRWTPDATGHTYWTYSVEMDRLVPIDSLADAVFVADNCPHELSETSLAGKIRAAMIVRDLATEVRHHSLSTGDRVRVSEVEVVCTNDGWQRVRA